MSAVPDWISRPLHSWSAWKSLIRSWIAVWAAFIIILPDKSLKTLGTTAFFSIITSLFFPPYLPVQLTLFLLSTLMLGLLAGWGAGIGAMRAANAVRSQAYVEAVAAQIAASVKSNPVFQADPTLATETAVFNGWFLELKPTAIYGVFMVIGGFIFGALRAYAPKLIFMSIFGTIAIDIFCCVGPLFPTKRYTLLNSTAISISAYMAIAVASSLLIFPETMSHLVMNQLTLQVGRIKKLVEMQDSVLRGKDMAADTMVQQFKALRAVVVATQQQIVSTAGFLSLEFSWGRWSGDDIRTLEEPVVALIARSSALLNFARLANSDAPTPKEDTSASSIATIAVPAPDAHWHETAMLHAILTQQTALEAEYGVRLHDVLPQLEEATRELRGAVTDAIGAAAGVIESINCTRWRNGGLKTAEAEAVLDSAGARLDKALQAFEETDRMKILAPFIPLFAAYLEHGTDTSTPLQIPLRSLYVAYVFASNLLSVAESVQTLVGGVQDLCTKRPRRRLWAPSQLRTLWKVIVARGDSEDGAFGEDTSPNRAGEAVTSEEKDYRRDPDSRPPTNVFQKIMHLVHAGLAWTSTTEAIFIFKYVFVSFALWIPAVVKHSAYFYYNEKGIWALIMAQTTLNIYASDQIFNYVTRIAGTFVGLAFGLTAWYAGNGHGQGNPYGMAAAYAVCVFPLVFFRVFGPEKYMAGTIMCCATFGLVVGYSWVDSHVVQFSTPGSFRPGIGWSIAWRRWALVVVGCAASFIVMMFPSQSGRKAVRMRNAASIASLANLYAFVISAWIGLSQNTNADGGKEGSEASYRAVTPAWKATFRKRLLANSVELQTIRGLTDLARWEGSIRGKWPAEQYTLLVSTQLDILTILTQLGASLTHLEAEWHQEFLHNSKVLNPNFIADVMALFSLISQALRTKEPMHQVLPSSLLDRLFYHHNHSSNVGHGAANQPAALASNVERAKSLSYIHYASSIVSVYQLVRAVDELHAIAKELCGEVPMAGFSEWRAEYEHAHLPV
ncbi:hypothetical protein HMN09_00546000 [Mycena chlorophos]|uniref:ER transporter 6TM N-terminal domain-containing protein n=1 Tax=Mycena chlorophos TaxID=658473 RepID=A0A8H6TBP1_MYCCL|nr:hypothetical protein HMN09_00546000 [Mycena chlorophos]